MVHGTCPCPARAALAPWILCGKHAVGGWRGWSSASTIMPHVGQPYSAPIAPTQRVWQGRGECEAARAHVPRAVVCDHGALKVARRTEDRACILLEGFVIIESKEGRAAKRPSLVATSKEEPLLPLCSSSACLVARGAALALPACCARAEKGLTSRITGLGTNTEAQLC